MRITCPSCEAEYAVPDDKIAGRVVKCARCETRWTPVPAAPEAPPPPLAARPEPPAWEPPPAPPVAQWPPPAVPMAAPAPPSRLPALLVAWVASVALLAAALAGAYAGRSGVMHAWPPSARLYAMLGLQ